MNRRTHGLEQVWVFCRVLNRRTHGREQVWFAQAEARFLQLREKAWEPANLFEAHALFDVLTPKSLRF
jgi:hypothetical protein